MMKSWSRLLSKRARTGAGLGLLGNQQPFLGQRFKPTETLPESLTESESRLGLPGIGAKSPRQLRRGLLEPWRRNAA